eukprot:TRINITY_DN2276_c0_g1_i1.p1 TRINITY_DN2276_c0_g1~~TRINITY_DN2276_c0_g1_i1.p1  ORF type:complete len:796 (+),score=256.91 TRINITY_DN2276_c0_g1_i1:88-2388(+)
MDDKNKKSKKLKKNKSENIDNNSDILDITYIQKESNINSFKMNKSRNNIKLNSSNGKKLTFKIKTAPTLPENFESINWSKLKTAIKAIHSQSATEFTFEELLKCCEDLVENKLSENLYNKLQKEQEEHMKIELKRLSNELSNKRFLDLINECWDLHCCQIILIKQIFILLETSYASKVKPIVKMGDELFRQIIIENPSIENKLKEEILHTIKRDREGETVDRILIKNTLRMFITLQLYDQFEVLFLKETKQHYEVESREKVLKSTLPDYLLYVESKRQLESDRVHHYLDPKTKKLLLDLTEQQLVQFHVEELLVNGFDGLIEDNNVQQLALLHKLFSRVGSVEAINVSFGTYCKRVGLEMVNDQNKEETLVQELLLFKEKLTNIVSSSFLNDPLFKETLRSGFIYFINSRANKVAELIAMESENYLKGGSKMGEEELERKLDDLISLLSFVNGKDVFEAFYKKHLSKRLLLGRSVSEEAEKLMISKLKPECGSQFTSKLEGMFKDIALSEELVTNFKKSLMAEKVPLSFKVFVLTAGSWPSYREPQGVVVPSPFLTTQDAFKQFYLTKYEGRKLTWLYSLSMCFVNAFFDKGKKFLSVSMFQTLILLLFNENKDLSYQQIYQLTLLEHAELKRTLKSLACGKLRVIKKEPEGKDIGENDVFSFRNTFTDKRTKIKVNTIQVRETVEENNETIERVIQDRTFLIDAAIVRIMKMRKVLSHSNLVSELFNQLKFPLQTSLIKQRIESLIDREYLERDENKAQFYHYLA